MLNKRGTDIPSLPKSPTIESKRKRHPARRGVAKPHKDERNPQLCISPLIRLLKFMSASDVFWIMIGYPDRTARRIPNTNLKHRLFALAACEAGCQQIMATHNVQPVSAAE